MPFRNHSKNTGFSLIELMVVVAIIGILMSAGILVFSNAQINARDGARIADLNALAKIFEQYYQDNGQYLSTQAQSIGAAWTTTLEPALVSYLGGRKLHLDPKNVNPYTYTMRSADRATTGDGSTKFCIIAKLENTGKANCTLPGLGVYDCPYTASSPTHYCVSSRQ